MTLRPDMTTKQRLKQRPWENAMGLILLLTSLMSFLSGGGIVAAHLSGIIAAAWIAANLAGGVLVLLGLHWRGSPVIARALEQVGWVTEATTLALITSALIYFGGWGLAPGVLDEVVMIGAMIFRVWFLDSEKRAEREAIELLRRKRMKGDG